MPNPVSVPQGAESNQSPIGESTGVPAQGGAAYPPYVIEAKVENGKIKFRDLIGGNPDAPWIDFSSAPAPGGATPEPPNAVSGKSTKETGGGSPQNPNIPPAQTAGGNSDPYVGLRAKYGADRVYPPPTDAAPNTNVTTTNNAPAAESSADAERAPYDPRLIFIRGDDAAGKSQLIYSFTAKDELMTPLVDGMIIEDPENKGTPINLTKESKDPNSSKKGTISNLTDFYGVPSIMNDNMYVSLIAAGGKIGAQFLRDVENKPRWYDMTSKTPRSKPDGSVSSSTAQLTVKDIIDWSQEPGNLRFPYRFQDFVFCKWWKKIPLNYLITLRRYTRPVIDNVTTQFDVEFSNKASDETKLADAAHAVTFLGEDAGNKISAILGPITAGLKWKDIKAGVWEIAAGSGGGGGGGSADTPLPGVAKLFAFLQNGVKGAEKKGGGGGSPQDPYNNGPYANKVIGPLTVIESTKGRERGIEFKHTIKLVFEYSARSVGGINPKAAMLDILGNMMILTFNEAAFWGGYNRHMPGGGGGGGGGGGAPFLGGAEGKKAWLAGDPQGFFKAITTQFGSVLDVVGDFFKELAGDPVGTLMGAGTAATKNFMKLNSAGDSGGGGSAAQQLHAILTGDPVGEWHVTVGNPMNPMMMIGNLICTGITINFNDELGPDDFPTEVKFEITLDHGMPRDRAAIEGMFNKGSGRVYSFPPGVKEDEMFASYNTTAVDRATGGKGPNNPEGSGGNKEIVAGQRKGQNGRGSFYDDSKGGRLKHLIDDPGMWERSFGYAVQAFGPRVRNAKTAIINAGFTFLGNGVSK